MAGLDCMWGAVDSNATREGKTRRRCCCLARSWYLYNIRFLFLSSLAQAGSASKLVFRIDARRSCHSWYWHSLESHLMHVDFYFTLCSLDWFPFPFVSLSLPSLLLAAVAVADFAV